MSSSVKVEVLQLQNGEGLALPAYQSALAAGLDLLAAVPEDSASYPRAGQVRADPHRTFDRAATGF